MTPFLERLRKALAGRYRIEGEAGRGGTATVFRALDLRHDRRVAIKVLHPELAAGVGTERFLREIRTAAPLMHPNVLPLYDSGEADGLLFFTMPLVEGESLAERLARAGPLEVEEALRIGRAVAGALAYAHARGIVHRDVKPENVLLGRDGQVWVADFGMGRALNGARERLTATGLAVGSPLYISPEQASGEEADERSDLYSLGCVLFEMLAGRPPFEGPSAQALLVRHLAAPPPPLRSLRPGVPEAVERAVGRALAKDPGERFASARELAEALRQSAAGDTHPAPEARQGGSRWIVTDGSGGRIRLKRVLLTLLALALGSTGWGAWHFLRRPAEPSPAAARVAVLYFDDLSPRGELGYLARGLTESMIHHLSQVDALEVVSGSGVRPFRARPVPLDSVSRSLGAGLVVDGSVLAAGDRLRISSRLVDASTGATLASQVMDRPRGELLALIDEVVREVSTSLRKELGREVRVRRWEAGTRSPDAWRLVAQASELRESAGSLAGAGDFEAALRTLETADSLLLRAEELDPRWSEPVVQRGWAAEQGAFLASFPGRRDDARMRNWLTRASRQAERALRLRPDDPAALELRGVVRERIRAFDPPADSAEADRLLRGAERDLRRAVAKDPGRARAWSVLSSVLLERGRFGEARVAAQQAYGADAFLTEIDEVVYRLFVTSFELEQDEDASRWCEEMGWRFDAGSIYADCALTLAAWSPRSGTGVEEAWEIVERAGRDEPPPLRILNRPRLEMQMAGVLARAGLADSARAVIRRAREAGAGNPELLHLEAAARARLGETQAAERLLVAYLRDHPRQRASLLPSRRFRSLPGRAAG